MSAPVAHAEGQAFLFAGRSFTGDFLLEDKVTVGGAIGAFRGPLGFEVTFDYTPLAAFTVGSLGSGVALTNVAGNVVVQVPIGDFAPYGTVGYGLFFADADAPPGTVDFLGRFNAFNFGFGAKVFVTDHFGVRIEYRRIAIQTDADNPKLRIPIAGITIDPSADVDRFTVGASFRF